MLSISVDELKKKEFCNVEKVSWEIANKLRLSVAESSIKIICIAYLASLSQFYKIESIKALLDLIEKNFSEERRLFIKENLSDAWPIVIEISKIYSIETLVAVVLWQQTATKIGAEYETPESIVKLANKLLAPEKGESVADFCCGMGCFLTHVVSSAENCSYYGVEINTYCKEIVAIRLEILTNDAVIRQGSAFSIEGERKFDKIFCDFPWNMRVKNSWADKKEIAKLEKEFPELKKVTIADWHFIVNVLTHLEKDGKAVVITTNGIAWNGGASKTIREQLIRRGYIEAVISLPPNLYATTSIPTTILVLSEGNKTIRMIDAGNMASVGRRQNNLSDDVIDNIAQMMTEDTEYSIEATLKEIENNDFAINPTRYLETELEVENGVLFEELITNITRGAQLKALELDELVSDEPTDYQYLMLSNIQDGLISDDLPYLKTLDKKNEKYCIKNNSLVISKNGTPVKIAVASVAEGRTILANGNLYVIELDETRVNPYFVKAYLESENGTIALSRITVGATLPNIPIDSLKKVMIPLPSMSVQKSVAEKYLEKIDELKVLKYKLAKVTAELKNIYEEG